MPWIQRRFRTLQKFSGPVLQRLFESSLFEVTVFDRLVVWIYDRYKSLEASPIRFIEKYVVPGTTVIDVGAHYGYFTIRLSLLTGANGLVVAFEPNQKSQAVLQRRISRKQLDNVRLLSAAAWSSSTNIHFVLDGPLGTTSHVSTSDGRESLLVEGRSIDEVVRDNPGMRVSFIKVDVEGSEIEVLCGSQKTLLHHRPVVLCEIGSEYEIVSARHIDALFELLDAVEYECRDVKSKAKLSRVDVSRAMVQVRYLDVLLTPMGFEARTF